MKIKGRSSGKKLFWENVFKGKGVHIFALEWEAGGFPRGEGDAQAKR